MADSNGVPAIKAVKNYYFILGTSRGASDSEINAAYEEKSEAAKLDPAQAALMDEVTEAYECLSNPFMRRAYDESFAAHDPPRFTGGNIYQFTSAETSVAGEFAAQKILRRQKAIARVRRNIWRIIKLAVIGACLYYARERWMPEVPLREIPRHVIETMKKTYESIGFPK
jgi:hypothetical protein